MKKVREFWNQIAYAAWRCADPVHNIIQLNKWHTCPEGGEIRASNHARNICFLIIRPAILLQLT